MKKAKLLGIHLKGGLNFDFYMNTLIKKQAKNVIILQNWQLHEP